MVCITDAPYDYGGCRHNPDSLPDIYMTSVMEAQCHIVDKNRRKQDEVKKIHYESSHITNQGISFEKILSVLANLWSDTDATEESTDSVLQGIISLSSDTLKDAFFHLGGNISDLPDLNNSTVAVGIAQMWGKHIIEEGAMTSVNPEDGLREGVIA